VLQTIPNAQFWCFGDGPLRPELEQTARDLGISDRFKLLGFRRDVPELMRAIDVMCLPSHREPFGLVYIEAALAEKPLIACNAGGAPEIIADGETGLLVPPSVENVAPLADAIFAMLDNRDRAAAMGRRGRELALDRFSWPAYLTRLVDLYAAVMDERTR
jgi:glycosyltransferase involved in cell wall biosynthesis